MKKLITILSLGFFAFGYSQSDYYNDYQRSITDFNWQTVAANLLLSSQQKADLFSLNNQYPDYNSWNRAYANNPDRWRTDRYSSIERIMGTEKYAKFKNKYYKGQNPVAVYNRNKNNHKKNRVIKYKNMQSKKGYTNRKSMEEYERRKNSGDGSHLYIKGKGHNNGKGKNK
ncbi:MAG: hypothetical protein L6264_10935 [Weeksellaceae bacterium]|nr:hypothetical protein [Bacteroidota bacterium]MCG2781450.1 hypothetical protein [Weeksellaceae bacterium]